MLIKKLLDIWSFKLTDIITPPQCILFGIRQIMNHFKNCIPFRKFLTRDIELTIFTELNIPTFFYSGLNENPSYPSSLAQRNSVCFS